MPWVGLVVLLLFVPGAVWAARRPRRAARTAAGRLAWRAWLPDLAGLGLLALAALGFFWRVVSGQNWMPADGGDLVSFLYPTYRFAAAALRTGAWPLWDPHLYAGAPHVADIQAGFLYPPNLLLFWLWPDFPYRALQWLSLAHLWFAGAGMFLFLARGCGLRRLAALAGALAFMFSDAFLIHFGNLNFNAVASWTPWVFWAFLGGLGLRGEGWTTAEPGQAPDPAPDEGPEPVASGHAAGRLGYGRAALAGVLLAIATLAGHIQVTLFILLALALYTLAWLWLSRADAGPGVRPGPDGGPAPAGAALLYLVVTTAVTVLLAAPALLPALQLAGYTARATWNYQEAAGYAVAPAQWIGLLMPGFFGSAPQFHWSVWPRVEVGYLGILPLALAALAVALRRGRQVWAWLALAAAAFLLALGPYALAHGWLTLLPGFGQLRAPARLVFIGDLGLAALAAIGLDAALRPLNAAALARLDRVRRVVAYTAGGVAGILLPLSYLALLLVQERDPQIQLRVSVALIAVALCAGLLLASLLWLAARRGGWARSVTLGWLALALILLDLGSNGAYQDLGNQDPSLGFSQPAIAPYLAGQPGPFRIDTRTGIEGKWQPDTALLYGLDDVGGLVNPLALADVTRYWEGLGSRSSRLYDLLNVRYVVAKKDVVLDWGKFELAYGGSPDLNVYANRRWLPRAFFVSNWQAAGSHEAAWQAIHATGFDPTMTAVAEDAAGPAAAGGSPAAVAHAEVTSMRTTTNGLSLQVRSDGPGTAMLVVSQVWYPGWQALIDGQAQGAPSRVDYLFQGVKIPPGAHQVELRFDPPLWHAGWWLAGATALGLAASVIGSRVRGRSVKRKAKT